MKAYDVMTREVVAHRDRGERGNLAILTIRIASAAFPAFPLRET
jgi:hypothetical protein